jgi:hypothetical protein
MDELQGYQLLEENIETTIYEGLLKLGYQKDESFSIYYDLDLLNHLLDTTYVNNEECLEHLQQFKTFVAGHLYNVHISLEKNRFKFTVPKGGITYINQLSDKYEFLTDIINKVKTHSFQLEDIKAIFEKYTKHYICEEIDNSEFQYVLYFKDKTIDPFKYCFTFDEMGGYYHRLLDFSYEKIMHDHEH